VLGSVAVRCAWGCFGGLDSLVGLRAEEWFFPKIATVSVETGKIFRLGSIISVRICCEGCVSKCSLVVV